MDTKSAAAAKDTHIDLWSERDILQRQRPRMNAMMSLFIIKGIFSLEAGKAVVSHFVIL